MFHVIMELYKTINIITINMHHISGGLPDDDPYLGSDKGRNGRIHELQHFYLKPGSELLILDEPLCQFHFCKELEGD